MKEFATKFSRRRAIYLPVLTLALGLATGTTSAATPANTLIYNGNFELAPYVAEGGYTTINGPATYSVIPSWMVGGTSVDVIRGAYGAISGNSIDLLGTPGPGSISTSFYGNAGVNYALSFDLYKNGNTGFVNVTFGDKTQQFSSADSISRQSMLFKAATSGPHNLSFSSVTSSNGDLYSGAVIDNVTVLSAVPEPETYAMLLAGLSIIGLKVMRRRIPSRRKS